MEYWPQLFFFFLFFFYSYKGEGEDCLLEEKQYQTVKHNCNQRSINGNRYASLRLRAMRQCRVQKLC